MKNVQEMHEENIARMQAHQLDDKHQFDLLKWMLGLILSVSIGGHVVTNVRMKNEGFNQPNIDGDRTAYQSANRQLHTKSNLSGESSGVNR